MRNYVFLILCVSLFFQLACENTNLDQNDISISPDSVTEVFPSDDSIPEDLIIRLNRTTCYGAKVECPAYLLTIKANGEVNFFGQDNVKTKGQTKEEISKDKVKKLIDEFKKAKFFELKKSYVSEPCETERATVRTTLFINDKVKKIEHDTGCEAPKELTNLENKIDEIVGTQKWASETKSDKNQ